MNAKKSGRKPKYRIRYGTESAWGVPSQRRDFVTMPDLFLAIRDLLAQKNNRLIIEKLSDEPLTDR